LLTVAGVPLLLSVNLIKDAVVKKQEVSASSQFLLLMGLLSLSFALVDGAFEGLVTSLGDDHSSRIITRYYEFLLPLLLIAAGVFAKFVEPKFQIRLIQSVILIAGIVFGWVYLSGVNQSFADSILLSGYLASPAVIPFVALTGIIVALVWILSVGSGSRLIVYVATPLVLLVAGFSSQGFLLSQVGTQLATFDVAGQKAHELLREVDGSKILVVGPMRSQNFTTKFWIDKPNISDFEIQDTEALDLSKLGELEYVVINGNASFSGNAEEIYAGDGFKILRANR
jgi:phosphoglycerol transferase